MDDESHFALVGGPMGGSWMSAAFADVSVDEVFA
jgi:hypothetical protein